MDSSPFVDERSGIVMKMWKKGGFTVEAAILIPFLLFLFVGVLQLGITFFQYSVTRDCYEGLEGFDAVRKFYDLQMLKDVGEEME